MQEHIRRQRTEKPASAAVHPVREAGANSLWQVADQSGDPSALQARMLGRLSGLGERMQRQIPAAEQEADRLSAGLSASTPEEVKQQLGERLNADFTDISFHTDDSSAQRTDAMGASAYTAGSNVYFGSEGFNPTVAAHELVHTVQQGVVEGSGVSVSAPMGGVQMFWNPFHKKTPEEIAEEQRKEAQERAAEEQEQKEDEAREAREKAYQDYDKENKYTPFGKEGNKHKWYEKVFRDKPAYLGSKIAAPFKMLHNMTVGAHHKALDDLYNNRSAYEELSKMGKLKHTLKNPLAHWRYGDEDAEVGVRNRRRKEKRQQKKQEAFIRRAQKIGVLKPDAPSASATPQEQQTSRAAPAPELFASAPESLEVNRKGFTNRDYVDTSKTSDTLLGIGSKVAGGVALGGAGSSTAMKWHDYHDKLDQYAFGMMTGDKFTGAMENAIGPALGIGGVASSGIGAGLRLAQDIKKVKKYKREGDSEEQLGAIADAALRPGEALSSITSLGGFAAPISVVGNTIGSINEAARLAKESGMAQAASERSDRAKDMMGKLELKKRSGKQLSEGEQLNDLIVDQMRYQGNADMARHIGKAVGAGFSSVGKAGAAISTAAGSPISIMFSVGGPVLNAASNFVGGIAEDSQLEKTQDLIGNQKYDMHKKVSALLNDKYLRKYKKEYREKLQGGTYNDADAEAYAKERWRKMSNTAKKRKGQKMEAKLLKAVGYKSGTKDEMAVRVSKERADNLTERANSGDKDALAAMEVMGLSKGEDGYSAVAAGRKLYSKGGVDLQDRINQFDQAEIGDIRTQLNTQRQSQMVEKHAHLAEHEKDLREYGEKLASGGGNRLQKKWWDYKHNQMAGKTVATREKIKALEERIAKDKKRNQRHGG